MEFDKANIKVNILLSWKGSVILFRDEFFFTLSHLFEKREVHLDLFSLPTLLIQNLKICVTSDANIRIFLHLPQRDFCGSLVVVPNFFVVISVSKSCSCYAYL